MAKKIIQKLKIIFVPTKENNFRPKFLESQILFYCAIVLLILKLFTVPFFLYFPENIFFAAIIKSALIELLNQDRESLGLAPLKENPKLTEAAYLKAKDILEKDYFAHYSPEGKSPWYWFKMAGYNYKMAGENLAIGFLDSEEVHRAWIESPSHRSNLFNPNYQEIGIAVLKGDFQGNETHVVVQLFGRPVLAEKVKEKPLVKKEKIPIKKKIASQETPLEKLPQETQKTPVEELPQETQEIQKIQEAPRKELAEKISLPEITVSLETPKEKLNFYFLSFLASGYHRLLQRFIYGFLILIITSLLINIFVRFDIQHPDLILKALGFILLLIIFLLLDKLTLIKIIPHNFNIY